MLAAGNAAADVENNIAQRNAHRDFDQAGVVDFAGEREDRRARRLGLPMVLNHAAPRRMIRGAIA